MPRGLPNPKHCRVDSCTVNLGHKSANVYCRTCIGAARQGPYDDKGNSADPDLVDIVASEITTHDLNSGAVARWFKAGLEKLLLCGVCQHWTLNGEGHHVYQQEECKKAQQILGAKGVKVLRKLGKGDAVCGNKVTIQGFGCGECQVNHGRKFNL
jgi:hypothetical protein